MSAVGRSSISRIMELWSEDSSLSLDNWAVFVKSLIRAMSSMSGVCAGAP